MCHMLATCFWKNIDSKMSMSHTDVHTYIYIYGQTHTLTHGMHTHAQIHTSVMHTHTDMNTYTLLAHRHTQHDVHTYTHTGHSHHTWTHHTYTVCKSDNLENSKVFSHTTSILVCTEQRRENRV